MVKDIVIDVNNISKKYVIPTDYQPDTLREKIVELAKYPIRALRGHHHKPKTKEYWALKDVSFQVKRGEVLGIIGKNGAGKSTLLKILSRTTEPTSGTITMKGKVSSLLEVGTGFNPELTGRENIYLNGAIIGMSQKEISTKFNSIVQFANIGEFINTPVKRYSSGMFVRLAFAVAAHLDADILLLDEVLAVGDEEFRKKSLRKMKSLIQDGRTIILVSHDIRNINDLCHNVLWINRGEIVASGKAGGITKKYNESSYQEYVNVIDVQRDTSQLISKVKILGKCLHEYGDKIVIIIETNPLINLKFGLEVIIKNAKKEPLIYISNWIEGATEQFKAGNTIRVMIPSINLADGEYYVDVNARNWPHDHCDRWNDATSFTIFNATPGKMKHTISGNEGMGYVIYDNVKFTTK